eukprot:CAMPEP_0177765088 /NCGR_PEP_ID=MMETSP0491_2-20121128/7800_1 /TAXON_ID=63592 /ORGANISM="Tetraselmis chuii, Strain PLY429" /LENGTH=54 /DNA_ID=CAMNT_0019281403 /DNA_START=244 /DNA_END=408 /DNA_ORIENTATION=+
MVCSSADTFSGVGCPSAPITYISPAVFIETPAAAAIDTEEDGPKEFNCLTSGNA